jgi:uncharacterized protein (TIGR02231 family)
MDIEAPISQVTVFSDRAQITRRARVALEAGTQELVIAGLPAGLDENSLRASGSGSVAVKILSVESNERPLEQAPHETARTLKDELQKATDEGQALKKRSEVLEERQKTVRELADNAAKRFAKALAEGTTSLENASQLLDFIQTQTQNINDERAALEKEIRGNIEHQALLQNRLKQLHGARKASDHCVTVALESASEGEFDLEVSYTVYGARWEPLYDARVQLLPPASPDGLLEGKLQLSYLAKITQNTGEDWKDVSLTLSTAQPHLGSLPPKLSPLYVDIYRPMPPMAMAAGVASRKKSRMAEFAVAESADLMEMDAEFAVAGAPAPIEAEHETASVESSGAGVNYELPRRLNVPSDGQPHRGTIAVPEFPVRLDFQAIPRRTEFAYLRATATNDSELSLLAGQANIYRDGAFIGAAQLSQTAPGGELKLFLGPDEQVKAKRELTKREVDKNFIGNVRRQNFAYQIEVENLKPHRVELTVLDQIPVARHEQIKVKPHHPAPQPETDDLGVMTWKLNLPAGARRELHSDYVVESPRDVSLTGLNE